MKLNVPYYSQQHDVTNEAWRSKACAIVAVKMVLDFYRVEDERHEPTIDELIAEGVAIGGYLPIGWDHAALIRLFHNHGLFAYNEEFRSCLVDLENPDATICTDALVKGGIEKIIAVLDSGSPVIVSAVKYFTEDDKPHVVVITGYEQDEFGQVTGLYYHDPEPKEEGGGSASAKAGEHAFVARADFETHWRRFAIFAGPVAQHTTASSQR